jgi:MFS family permease
MWTNSTQVGCCIEAFMVMLILLLNTYYLPLYYQSAQGKSATSSGISIIAFMICTVGGAIGAGATINKFGRPLPFLLISPLLSAIGCGLIFWNLTTGANSKNLYGFQALTGFGVGGALQNTIIVIQAAYHDRPRLVPQATSLVNFTQLTGGIIGISIAGTIFGNRLTSAINKYAPDLPASTAEAVRNSVAVIYTLEGEQKANVIRAYSESLGYVFILGIPAAILGSCAAVLIKNINLKKLNIGPSVAHAA